MRVLMVCLGNICRSPMAEGILRFLIKTQRLPWEVGSAAISDYHIGQPPHVSSQKVCHINGVDISEQRARLFQVKDFKDFDLIYAMDSSVLASIAQMAPSINDAHKIKLFLDEQFPGQNKSVTDPWYGPESGFETVFQVIYRGCQAILKNHAGINA